MELMVHTGGPHGQGRGGLQTYDYDQNSAHSVEVRRETDENGDLGTFGFTLQYEKPPIVGTIVPGGPADRAGLKKLDIVIAVNGQDTTSLPHQEVVDIISRTKTPGVWLTVCEGPECLDQTPSTLSGINRSSGPGFNRVHSLGSFSISQSTPAFPRNMTDSSLRYVADDTPPKYQDLPKYTPRQQVGGSGGGGNMLGGHRAVTSSSMAVMNTNISPLTRKLLTQSMQQNGHASSSSNLHHRPSNLQVQNGHLATFGSSDQSLFSNSKPSPTPAAAAFTSASVLVLYIGPVEIPEAWSSRELSSKCLQECTRHLLSQRQEFIEAFLEVTLTSMKILAVSQAVIFKHKREELYYAGVCSNDEQYFGIVTRKVDQKGGKKSLSGSNISKPVRAHMCHVFKVIQHKSVLILHSGDSKGSGKSKQILPTSQHKQKTIPVMSCVTVVNAIQGLFTGATAPGSKIFDESFKPSNFSSPYGGSGSNENVYSNGSPDKTKKKKLEVVDLRPFSYISPPSSSILTSAPNTNQNMYVSLQHTQAPATNHSPFVNHHVRSQSNPATDYPVSIGTPAFHQRSTGGGGGGGGGGGSSGNLGGGVTSGGGTSWYTSDSPKEEHRPRTSSWDNSKNPHVNSSGKIYGSSGNKRPVTSTTHKKSPNTLQYDKAKRFSDDSSISSLSDSRASSPTKMSHRSSYASHSRSPSPSYSSRSRSPSPAPPRNPKHNQGHVHRTPRIGGHTAQKLTSGLGLEVGSTRSGAISPYSMARSYRGTRATNLRRQGSESSVMDLQDLHTTSSAAPQHYGEVGAGLPPKNGPLSSSIGSVATITTVADKANDPEECGRVAGWVASFDRLLQDPLGVHTLLQFLKKEHCEENILFWKDIQEFKENASQDKNLSATVKKIYDEYLAPSSPNTVNIDDRVKKSIEARLANPPLNIFSEAFEQIYQLMKMDCYPRFKKSSLVKDCLMAEMEGRPLPIDLPHDQQQQQQQQTQFTGIWKRTREVERFTRSIFGRSLFSRGRVQHEETQVPVGAGIWGASPEGKGGDSAGSTPENRKSRKSGRDSNSPRLRKAHTVKDKSKRRSAGTSSTSSRGSTELKGESETSQPSEEFPPADHLNIFKAHKSNVFEVNLPNKVTKIMEVPPKGTVRDAIQPVLKKHGYNLDIMELHFANNFNLIELNSPASILIGQHIVVIKSKNTFIAAFPDVLERILPADGTKTIGDLFVGVLKEMGKLQNFSVGLEGARVSLELSTNTSVLVGQRVVIKYLPGTLNWKSEEFGSADDLQSKSKTSLNSSSSSTGRQDMDDLLSMIERLSSDKLDDQRTSPNPVTPEPEDLTEINSPEDLRKRSRSHGKRPSPNSSHRPLTSSKSTDFIEVPKEHVSSSHAYTSGHDKHRRERKHQKDNYLKLPGSRSSHGNHFARTQSGGSLLNNSQHQQHTTVSLRSLSPPADIRSGEVPDNTRPMSPPPPTSKPPPLPSHAKRLSGSRSMQPPTSRLSGASFKSTDSASSEDSLTADLPRHPKQHGRYSVGTPYDNRDYRSSSMGSRPAGSKEQQQPQYFPRAYPQGPSHSNQQERTSAKQYPRSNRTSTGSRGGSLEPSPSSDFHGSLDALKDSNLSGPKGNYQGKPLDYSNTSHPLQTSVSRPGHQGGHPPVGATLSSYPWRSAQSLTQQQQYQQQQRRSSMPRTTAATRSKLAENPELMQAGDQLVQQEIEEYRRNSTSDAGSSGSGSHPRTPLSPTTHTLTLPEDTDSDQYQRETFV